MSECYTNIFHIDNDPVHGPTKYAWQQGFRNYLRDNNQIDNDKTIAILNTLMARTATGKTKGEFDICMDAKDYNK